jgi:hypothetical protein
MSITTTPVANDTTTTADDGAGQAPLTSHYALPGVPWLAVDVNSGIAEGVDGTLTVGPAAIAVQLTPPVDGAPARIDVQPTGLTLSAISAAAVAAGGTDPLADLPSSLAAFVGGIAVAHIGVTIDMTAVAVTGIEVTIAADQPWWVLPDHFEVDDLHLTVAYTRAGDSHTVEVTGGGTVLGSVVELTVLRGDDDSFTFHLHGPDGAGIAVPGIGEIAGMLGGIDLAGALPPGLSDVPGFVLSEVAVVLTAGGVDSAHVSIAGGSAWSLPDPIGLTIDELALSVTVEHPADSATRTVEISVEGAATFAEAAITVTLERKDDQWTLTGGLQPGSSLTASAIARTYGVGLPAHLPELALSQFTVSAVIGGGELTVSAASSTEWTVPVGPDGIGVGALAVMFSRHAADADGRTFTGSISGEVHLGGIVVPVSYTVPGGLKLTATVPSFQPFAVLQDLCGATVIGSLALPPELLALALTDLELTIDVERSEVSFAATGPGFKRVQTIVRKSTSWGFALGIELDDNYRFSSLSPALGGLDAVQLPDALIVISTFDDTAFTFDELQPVAGTGVEHGLLIDGRLDLSGLGADKFLGESHLDVKAHVGTSLSELSLAAGIGDVTITDGVVLKDAEFELVPDPENVSISVSGAVDVTIDASPLEFIGGVRVVPNGISFFATMKGTWNQPFGAKGVALSDVSLEIGSDFEGVPSIGITGGLQIGAFAGKAGVSFNSEFPTQSVLIVAFNHLSLMDIVGTFCPPSVTAGIPANIGRTLAGISLDDVELYVVPQDTSIGKISYDQGLRVAGTLNVAGFSASAKVEIDPAQGVEVAGSLSPVQIGDVFSLTADGSNAGPSLDIQVKATAVPTIVITGQAALLGLTAAAHVTLSDQGFDFGCAGKVFGVFDAAVTAKGSSLQSADGFSVHAQMSQNFLSDLTSRAAGILQQAAAQAAAQISSAQRDVTNAQAEVDRLNTLAAAARADLANKQADAQRQIANAQAQVTGAQNSLSAIDAQIASTRAGIQAERDAAAKKIQDAQAAVNAAQGPVNDLNSQISSLQAQINQLNSDIAWWNNWYNNSAWYEKAYRWAQLSAEVGWRGTQVAGLTTAVGTLQGSVATANGVLQVAVQTLHAAQAAAVTYPIDQDPRIVALQTGRSAAVLALQAAQGVLSAAQQTTAAAITAAGQTVTTLAQQAGAANTVLQTTNSALGLLQQGIGQVAGMAGYIAQYGLGALLDVRSASFDGSISATHGGAVTLDATVVFQGSSQAVHLAYDFNDLVAGAKALAKAVVPSLPV